MNQKKITCLAIDDEPPALQVIEKYVTSIPALQLAATCNNAVDALAVLQNNQIDLLFLDIQMPYILGTDFMRTLPNPPKVIFTTAFRKYAVDGFGRECQHARGHARRAAADAHAAGESAAAQRCRLCRTADPLLAQD